MFLIDQWHNIHTVSDVLVKVLKLLHHLLQDCHVVEFPGITPIFHELSVYMCMHLSVFVCGVQTC